MIQSHRQLCLVHRQILLLTDCRKHGGAISESQAWMGLQYFGEKVVTIIEPRFETHFNTCASLHYSSEDTDLPEKVLRDAGKELYITTMYATENLNCTGTNNCTSQNGADDNEGPTMTMAQIISIAIVSGIASLTTVFGNILVIVAFFRERRLRVIGNYFVMSMAIADLLIGIFSMPLYTMYLLLGMWPLGPFICDIWLALDYVCCAASVLGILMISVDRYRSLSSPMTYRSEMTRLRACILIFLGWLFSALLFGVPIIGWQYFEGNRTIAEDQCEVQFLSDPTYTTGSIILIYWLPLMVILILYGKIYMLTRRLVKSQARIIGKLSIRQDVRHDSRHRNNNERMMKCTTLSGDSDEEHERGIHFSPPPRDTSMPVLSEEEYEECLSEAQKNSQGKPCNGNRQGKGKISKCSIDSGVDDDVDGDGDDEDGDPHTPSDGRKTPKGHMSSAKDHNLGKTLSAALMSLREAKAVRTLSAILGIFILCWTPYSVLVIVYSYCEHCVPYNLYSFSYWLCYINSTCNPACYAMSNKDFKVAFKRILCCGRKKYSFKTPLY
ncbi:muscarinic acetylcholine receptor M1-like [Amphiura filiformis]|uniref:muscarinic acetylcholine receptor M1-like n=1 Tax=Amphiura filiformis TaxID=82378 RepID=UPI003B21A375